MNSFSFYILQISLFFSFFLTSQKISVCEMECVPVQNGLTDYKKTRNPREAGTFLCIGRDTAKTNSIFSVCLITF